MCEKLQSTEELHSFYIILYLPIGIEKSPTKQTTETHLQNKPIRVMAPCP